MDVLIPAAYAFSMLVPVSSCHPLGIFRLILKLVRHISKSFEVRYERVLAGSLYFALGQPVSFSLAPNARTYFYVKSATWITF